MGRRGAAKKREHTPVMQQFLRAKGQHPDAIVFFRLGDFYEMFYEDAIRATDLLDIALTSRGTGPDGEKIPMAGVPHHAAAGYLATLLRAGEKVAICEQMADSSSVRGVVPLAVGDAQPKAGRRALRLQLDCLAIRFDRQIGPTMRGDRGALSEPWHTSPLTTKFTAAKPPTMH